MIKSIALSNLRRSDRNVRKTYPFADVESMAADIKARVRSTAGRSNEARKVRQDHPKPKSEQDADEHLGLSVRFVVVGRRHEVSPDSITCSDGSRSAAPADW